MDSTVNNPSVPYLGAVPQSLKSGALLRIQGTPNSSSTCFSINLQCGPVPRQDVALHLSPVFTSPPRLVRNSIQNQQWGPEESHGPSFPFTAGQNFEILILVETNEYKIAVNGSHFAEFDHRLPFHNVSHLAIDGDVQIHLINFEFPQSPTISPSSAPPDVSMPIGFVTPKEVGANPSDYRPSSPYGGSSLPYPTGNMPFGPQPSAVYPSSPSHPYGPQPTAAYPSSPSHPYGPQPATAYPSSPSHPYGPPPGGMNPYPSYPPSGNPYGGSSPSHPYGPPPGGYPSSGYPAQSGGYPTQSGGYPTQPVNYPYPSQPGPYPGTTVVYPGQEKDKSSSGSLSGLATLGTALASGIGGAVLAGKHGKHGHGHGFNPASALMGGGPASMIAGGLMGSKGHKSKHGSSGGATIGGIPMGTALAGGAAALAGTYMLSKSPIGKAMKPKKMKKLYKHKHKLKHGFGGFYGSSSSSSSSEEEE